MAEFLQDNMLYIGLILFGYGLIRVIYLFLVTRNQKPKIATIIEIKRKTRKKGRYTYPVVELENNQKIYCFSARKRGHTYYDDMKTIELYECRNVLWQNKHVAKTGLWRIEFSILISSIALVILSFVL
jgi:hypothetical protein